jgi:hypothetical protein
MRRFIIIIRVIIYGNIRWVGDVARIGGVTNEYKILVGKPKRKSIWKTVDVERRIILK